MRPNYNLVNLVFPENVLQLVFNFIGKVKAGLDFTSSVATRTSFCSFHIGSRTNTPMRRGDLQVVLAKMAAAAAPCPPPGSSKAPPRSVVGGGAPKMAIPVGREFVFKVSDFI